MRKIFFVLPCLIHASRGHTDVARSKLYKGDLYRDVGRSHRSSFTKLDCQEVSSWRQKVTKPSRMLASFFLAFNSQMFLPRVLRGHPLCTGKTGCRTPAISMKDEDKKGLIGGAVLGGLLAGPFGAVVGAQLGGSMGAGSRERREQEEQLDRMGLSKDIVKLAEQTAQELAAAESSLQLVEQAERSQSRLVQQFDDSMTDLYAAAEKSLRDGDEDRARSLLGQRQSANMKKEAAQKELNAASQRVASMRANVAQIAGRATEIEQLVSRSVVSKQSMDASAGSELQFEDLEDPWERKFRDLEKK